MRTSRQILNSMMCCDQLSFNVAESLYNSLTYQQRYNMTHGLPVDIFQPLQMQMIRALKEAAEFDRLGTEAIKLHGTLIQKRQAEASQLLATVKVLKNCADMWARKQGFRGRAPPELFHEDNNAVEDEGIARQFLTRIKPQRQGIVAAMKRAQGEPAQEPVIQGSGVDGEIFALNSGLEKKRRNPVFDVD